MGKYGFSNEDPYFLFPYVYYTVLIFNSIKIHQLSQKVNGQGSTIQAVDLFVKHFESMNKCLYLHS